MKRENWQRVAGKNIYLNWGKRGYVTLPLSVFFKTKFQSRYLVQILKFKLIIEKEINYQIQNFLINTKLFSLSFLDPYIVCTLTFFLTFKVCCYWFQILCSFLPAGSGRLEEKVGGKNYGNFSLIPRFSLPEYFLLLH